MAQLTDADYQQIKKIVKNDIKSWGISKQEFKDLFQAAEDWFVEAFSAAPTDSFPDALSAVVSVTLAQAKWIGKAWFTWRISQIW